MIIIWFDCHNDCNFTFDQGGEEKVKIERPGGSPVWTLSWNPSKLVELQSYDILKYYYSIFLL